MEFIAFLANGFIELFKAGAATFIGWVTGIIPLVVVLMTAVSACIKLIGEDRVYDYPLYDSAYSGCNLPGQSDVLYIRQICPGKTQTGVL